VLANQGILDCYDLKSGREIYRQRIPHQGGGFSASPVAADGRIYLSGEDGDIFVVKAGSNFELLSSDRTFRSKTEFQKNAASRTQQSWRIPPGIVGLSP
jgi:outer membrane protein assembly factor BamB